VCALYILNCDLELGFRTDVRKIAHPTDKSNAKALVEGFEAMLGLQYWQADRDEREKKWMQC
jgi:hypothetical protein